MLRYSCFLGGLGGVPRLGLVLSDARGRAVALTPQCTDGTRLLPRFAICDLPRPHVEWRAASRRSGASPFLHATLTKRVSTRACVCEAS